MWINKKNNLYEIMVFLTILLVFSSSYGFNQENAPFYVDLRDVVNTPFEDDGIVGNGAGGWLDKGINDMFIYPPLKTGEVISDGYHFNLIDPEKNEDKSVLILKGEGEAVDYPETVSVSVPAVSGRFVYILHHVVDQAPGTGQNSEAARYSIRYSDGTSAEIRARLGKELRSWNISWNDRHGSPEAWPIFKGVNYHSLKYKQYKAVWATQWENPFPKKEIEEIELTSAGNATIAVFAITIAEENYQNSPNVQDGVDLPPLQYWITVPFDYFDEKLEQVNPLMFKELEKAGMVEGVRDVQLIRSDMVAITVDPALTKVAEGVGEKKAAAFQVPETFTISSSDDASYNAELHPINVGRKSFEYWNGKTGPFSQSIVYWHTYYLQLPHPLSNGSHYKISVNPMDEQYKTSGYLYYDEKSTVTPAIKINQVAYSALASKRYAYVGWWAADFGKVDFSEFKNFSVIDENSGRIVLEGDITFRRADDELSGEDVYQMDLSALEPGKYHILIPGMARSYAFHVGGQQIYELYHHTNRAFFHQRCGQEFTEPFTSFSKSACHVEAYEGGHLVLLEDFEGDYLRNNPRYVPKVNEQIKSFRGGYHDAADFDTFTRHLRATAQTLAVFEYAPEKFGDGDLNIPEGGNGIPDLLDEAEWALSFYKDNQEAEGGIPFGRGNDQDYILDWERNNNGNRPPFGVFQPTRGSSFTFAAVAAQYARLVRPYDAERAEIYLDAAKRSYAWADTIASYGDRSSRDRLSKPWASGELYSTTGIESYNKNFREAYAKLSANNSGPAYFWGYANSTHENGDKNIKDDIKKIIIRAADAIVAETEKPAYRVGAGERVEGLGWGNLNGGGHYAEPAIRAYMLTSDQKYLDAAILNADFQLGANPLGKTFITGMGVRHPLHPQISTFLYTGPDKTGDTVKGITVYGISDRQLRWYPREIPVWRRWRDLGNGGAEISSEFTVSQTIGASSMLYSLLYALQD